MITFDLSCILEWIFVGPSCDRLLHVHSTDISNPPLLFFSMSTLVETPLRNSRSFCRRRRLIFRRFLFSSLVYVRPGAIDVIPDVDREPERGLRHKVWIWNERTTLRTELISQSDITPSPWDQFLSRTHYGDRTLTNFASGLLQNELRRKR